MGAVDDVTADLRIPTEQLRAFCASTTFSMAPYRYLFQRRRPGIKKKEENRVAIIPTPALPLARHSDSRTHALVECMSRNYMRLHNLRLNRLHWLASKCSLTEKSYAWLDCVQWRQRNTYY